MEKHLGITAFPTVTGELISFYPERALTLALIRELWKLISIGKTLPTAANSVESLSH